jgi:hypothetical protein
MPPRARSTRAKSKVNHKSSPQKRSTRTPKERINGKKRAAPSPSEDVSTVSEPENTDTGASDSYQESSGHEDDVQSLHSDALDEDSDRGTKVRVGKRKRSSPVKPRASKGSPSRKRLRNGDANDDNEGGEDPGLKEGQELVGMVVQAPKTGRGELLHFCTGTTTRTKLSPQFPPVRYLKTRSTSFCSSRDQNATTVNGGQNPQLPEPLSDTVRRLGSDYIVCFSTVISSLPYLSHSQSPYFVKPKQNSSSS